MFTLVKIVRLLMPATSWLLSCRIQPWGEGKGQLPFHPVPGVMRTNEVDRRSAVSETEIIEIVKASLNELLRWVGFGTLAGLAAKGIMPGRDPGGALATMLMGIGGSVIGCGTVLFFWREAAIDPISGKGFIAATLGAFTLLFFYRLLSGSFI